MSSGARCESHPFGCSPGAPTGDGEAVGMTWSTQSEPPPLASLALPTTLGSPTPSGVPPLRVFRSGSKRLRRGMGEFCLFGDPGEPPTGGQLEWAMAAPMIDLVARICGVMPIGGQ